MSNKQKYDFSNVFKNNINNIDTAINTIDSNKKRQFNQINEPSYNSDDSLSASEKTLDNLMLPTKIVTTNNIIDTNCIYNYCQRLNPCDMVNTVARRTIEDICEITSKLAPDQYIKSRPGKGKGQTFDYLERHICLLLMRHAFGILGHKTTVVYKEPLINEGFDKYNKPQFTVNVECDVEITVEPANDKAFSHKDIGYGEASNKSLFDAIGLAKQKSSSNGEKRTLIQFGPLFGLYLYDTKYKKQKTNK